MSRPPRVLVAGGSLGGLTAAHVLGDLGCDVTVLERSPEPLTGRGAGIVLHPATVRWWRERDVRPLHEMSAAMRRLRYLDADGAIADEQACRYRVSSFDALYRDLSARMDPARHRLGCAVAGFDVGDDGVTVALEGGGSERCDLLVGADGIGSRARQHAAARGRAALRRLRRVARRRRRARPRRRRRSTRSSAPSRTT